MAYGDPRTLGQRTVATGVASKGLFTKRGTPLTKDITTAPKINMPKNVSVNPVQTQEELRDVPLVSAPRPRTPNPALTSDQNNTSLINGVVSLAVELGAFKKSENTNDNIFSSIIGGVGRVLGMEEGGFVTKNKGSK